MIKIFNTLTKQKEEFIPLVNKRVHMFVCGPTVYDYIHIGNARTFIVFDVIAKYLKSRGYEVFYLQNITDIDDKIIDRAKKEGRDPKEVARTFEEEYLKDLRVLGVDSFSKHARATDHIEEIVKQIKRLLAKGYAYRAKDGIYFDISKFDDYGKLARRTVQQAEDAISRIDDSKNKKNKGDFVLWKFEKPGDPSWDTEIGRGRPGWHIEDTAMSEKYLGQQYDIHCGGLDLMFPHHESEIAQQEAASGKKPFVKYWLHAGLLTVEGQKMSKSLGNFVTARDALKKYTPEALRLFMISAHYRSSLDYSKQSMDQAQAAVIRIEELKQKLRLVMESELSPPESPALIETIIKADRKFGEKMDDDFNTPEALAIIFESVKELNEQFDQGKLSKKTAHAAFGFLNRINKTFGVLPKKIAIPKEIITLAAQREKMRNNQDFDEADAIRSKIKQKGYDIKDTLYGTLLKKS